MALLTLSAGLIAWQLFAPPSLGVADNNDFPKLIGRYCLAPAGEHPLFEYVNFSYVRDPGACWNSGLLTSAVVPLGVARMAAGLVLPPGRFDTRFLGAAYGLLFLGAFQGVLLLARGFRLMSRILLPVAVLAIFGGAAYVPWFNSFYFDTASLVFLLLSAVAVCRLVLSESVALGEYLLATGCVTLLAASKSQHAPLALLMIPCLWLSFGRPRFPARPVRGAAAGVILAAAALTWTTAPRWYQTIAVYNALFYQSLPQSSDPAGDLAQLGIDRHMLQYVGQHAFSENSPMQRQDGIDAFGRQMSVGKLAVYFVSHPRVTLRVLGTALKEASLQRVRMEIGSREYRLGNYERSSGHSPEAQSDFLDGWAAGKALAFGNRPWLYAAYGGGLLALAWGCAVRSTSRMRARAVLLVGTLTALVGLAGLIVLFDGVDMGRHMLIFNTLLDMTVCATVAAVPQSWAGPD